MIPLLKMMLPDTIILYHLLIHLTITSLLKVPNVVLQPMGPHYDLEVRRSQLPSEDMWKAACRKDKRCVAMHPCLCMHPGCLYLAWGIS
jgi:hypothetical protein